MTLEIIAEWGQPRTLTVAKRQVEATRAAGAQWAKWQVIEPAELASRDAAPYWDTALLGGEATQHEQFAVRKGWTVKEWTALRLYCHGCGVRFMATPFSLGAVRMLGALTADGIKIASGDITYRALIERAAATNCRLFISTGAATTAEVRAAAQWGRALGCVGPTLLACDLVYPCSTANANLARQLPRLAGFGYGYSVGYSDHTREVVTGAVAVALGATVLEKHVTLTPDGPRPDDHMALTVGQMKDYIARARDAAELCAPSQGDPQAAARVGARRAAHAARDLTLGQKLTRRDIRWLRPAPERSLPPTTQIEGLTLRRPVAAGALITEDDLA